MSSAEERRHGETRAPRNGRINSTAGRDKPIFTQMRRNQRAPTRQEFFTESTNTSYIPSPSPVRSSTFVKPRQAWNNAARATNSAHKASSDDKETEKEDDRAQSTPALSEERSRSRTSSTKRSPVHISAEGSPQPSAHASNRTATRTPSPPRGREERPDLVSPASFVSESSEPPHALPEIYRRIEDEESIAGASDVSSSAKGSPEHTRIKRLSLSPSPAGIRSSSARRLSPQSQEVQEEEIKPDGVVRRSPSPSSPKTSASSSFEETVETDQEMLARDEQRVREAISSDTMAFAKSRKGRANLTLENLRRQETQEPKDSNSSQSQDSGRSSEPGAAVPSTWGSKARRDKLRLESLSKSRQVAVPGVAPAQAVGTNASENTTKATKSVKDWLRAATASPIVEVQEPADGSKPVMLKQPLRERSSFDKARQWESQSRNGTLSPPKTTAQLAALRERSIERLEKSAVATNRLGALGDTRSLQRIARKASGSQIGEAREPQDVHEEAPTAGKLQVTSPEDKAGTGGAMNREALRDTNDSSNVVTTATPVVKPNGPVSPEVAKHLAFAAASQPKSDMDSRDLLRRFSRASSSSPAGNGRSSQASSLRSDESNGQRPSPLSLQADAMKNSAAIANEVVTEASGPPTDSGARADGRAPIVEPPRAHLVQFSISEVEPLTDPPVKAEAPRRQSSNEMSYDEKERVEKRKPLEATPKVDSKGVYLKTPRVTGGWIDTPIATAKKLGMIPEDISDPANEYDEESLLEAAKIVLGTDKAQRVGPRLQGKSRQNLDALVQTAPDLPHSALAAIIDHAKRKNRGEESSEGEETLQLDESTIRSLEKLLVKDEEEQAKGDEKPLKAFEVAGDAPTGKKLAISTKAKSTRHSNEPKEESKVKANDEELGAPAEIKALTRTKSNPTVSSTSSSDKHTTVSTSNGANKDPQTGRRAVSDPLPRDRAAKTSSKPALTVAIEDSPKHKGKPKKSVAVVAPEETCDQAGEFHDFIWPCDACRKRARAAIKTEDETIGVVQWQALQIPRLWTWSGAFSWYPRLTRLGWFLLLVVTCLWIESVVASLYTPPFYAWKMDGFGVDYDMVRPPFVVPKLIWRSHVGAPMRWIWWVISTIVHFVAGVMGVDLNAFGQVPPPPRPTKWIFKPAYESSGYTESGTSLGDDSAIWENRWPF